MTHAERVEQARQSWNDADLDGYLTLYNESIQVFGSAPGPLGKPAVAGLYRLIWDALGGDGRASPQLDFHEVLEQGDLYSCRFSMSGVHRGEFMGVPATGRDYVLTGITQMRFGPDGTVVERWTSLDTFGFLVQLGVLPPPPS